MRLEIETLYTLSGRKSNVEKKNVEAISIQRKDGRYRIKKSKRKAFSC